MSQAIKPAMSTEEFLTWERAQERPWEFDGFEPRAMTGGTDAHHGIQANTIAALVIRLRGGPCRVRGQGMKIQIGDRIRYPDAFVTCTPIPRGADISQNPIVLIEVLSKSTQRTDRVTKLIEYCSLPSARRYVLLEQDQVLATIYTRTPSGWVVSHGKPGEVLDMPEISISIPMDELYEGIDLSDPDPEDL